MRCVLIFFLCFKAFFLSLQSLEPFLKDVRQITSVSQGFERAGEAYFSPDGKTIVFQAVPKGNENYQIYIMNLEEGSPVLVSTGKGACTCAFFRPDGKKIIFASSHASPFEREAKSVMNKYVWDLTPYMNIYEANLDGSDLVPLTSGPAYHAECSYSSDGSEIVYASNETGSMNLYIMNADGSHVRQITHTDYSYNGGPFFSPNDSQILFRSDRFEKDLLQIFLVDRNGKEKQLTNNKAVNWAPYWHRNGKVIVYTTSIHGHGQYELYLLNIETGLECRLTESPSFDGLPVFNLKGDQILWTSKRGDGTSQVFLATFIMPDILTETR